MLYNTWSSVHLKHHYKKKRQPECERIFEKKKKEKTLGYRKIKYSYKS